MRQLITLATLLLGLNALAADHGGERNGFRPFTAPVGAWLLEVEFPALDGAPPPPPAFRETLTFHAFGTASESNTLLNENSYNPALGQGCGLTGPGGALELNCNGGEGTGSWRRTGRNTLDFIIVKLVYDGAANTHVGFLRVRGTLRFTGDRITHETAIAIPLGGANAAGVRIH